MNTEEFMNKYHLTDEDLDRMAEPYEEDTFVPEDGPIHYGSHIDNVGKERVTVVYDASITLRVKTLAQNRGVTPEDIYRAAMDYYLAEQAS